VLPALAGLFPWLGVLPQAVGRLRFREDGSRNVLRIFMFASTVTALVFYSLSSSKLASYSLVCIPPLAIVIGLWLDEAFDGPVAPIHAWTQTIALLAATAVALLTLPLWAGRLITVTQLFGAVRPLTSDVGALLTPVAVPLGWLVALGVGVLAMMRSTKGRAATVATIGALVPIVVLVAGRPTLQAMYPWEDLGRQIVARPGHAWLLGRRAPSLTFYAKRTVVTAPDEPALERDIRNETHGWLALTHEDWAKLAATEALKGKDVTVVCERGRMVLVWFETPSNALRAGTMQRKY
jgi:4-amino-4-deoxy-L-arabinose transferase-like glycosyltransferase